jgi:hypothetical protein
VVHGDAVLQAELHDYARSLSAAETPGVKLWTQVLQRAVDYHAGRADLTVQERFDAVLRDTGAVLVGERTLDGRFRQLQRVDDGLLGWLVRSDPLVAWFRDELVPMHDGLYAGGNLDTTTGSDFRAEFRDGTDNQIYHTYFYVVLGYATRDPATVNRGSLYHEVFDPGGSWADFAVGNWAGHLGAQLRRWRDEGNLDALRAMPTLVGATFSADGAGYGHPRDTGGADFRGAAKTMSDYVADHVHDPVGSPLSGLRERTRRGLIDFVNR